METADTTRQYVSTGFVGFISGIDRFFGGDRNFQDSNLSVLQLNLNELMQKGGERQAQAALRAKLHLPSTQHRLHLLLESNPENNTPADDAANQSAPVAQSTTAANYGVAVRYENDAQTGWRYSTDFGLKTQLPLQPFARARLSYTLPLDNWRMKVAETVSWFRQPGAGETTQIDFDHPLSDDLLFRASTLGGWLHIPQRFDLRQDFSLFHTLDGKRALAYQLSAVGTNRPQRQASDYVAAIRYRQQLNRRWLFLEVNPQLHYPKEAGYHLTPLLLLQLEILFDKAEERTR